MEHASISNQSDNSVPLGTGDGYAALTRGGEDGACTLEVMVDGVHCAGCIQKIESRLSLEQGMDRARLNFSTRRLTLNWHGAAANANHYVQVIEGLGYTVRPFDAEMAMAGTAAEEKFLLLCLAVAGFAMGNIMLLSFGLWITTADTMGPSMRDLMHGLSGLIAVPAVLFSGRPFFRSAGRALRAGTTNMDVPISVALILTSLTSIYQTLTHAEHAYFDSVVMLIFFLLIGRYLDVRARRSARSAATDLLGTLTGFAHVVEGDRQRQVPIRDVREGMVVRVAAGEKIPVDGTIIEGTSAIDTSLVTGETAPRDVGVGQDIYAGTMNLAAPLTFRVARAAEQSLLADIVRLMERAGQGQAAYVRLADRAARYYTPVVHSFAAASFLFWWGGYGMPAQSALMIAVAVLIITCPCAIALAVPVVQVVATGRLMKRGVLVKSGDALERLSAIDTVIFDKTGTLTHGQPVLRVGGDQAALQLAASLASHSRHPYSRAIVTGYSGELLSITDVIEQAGAGLSGIYNGVRVRLGSRLWCGDANAPVSNDLEIWLNVAGQTPVRFTFKDELRDDAGTVVQALQKAGLQVLLVSGDRTPVVALMAQAAGITRFYAEQTPPQKFDLISDLKAQGHKILMVGDGLNDAPALAHADVSMAPGTAIDMAQNAADMVFMGEKLAPVFETIRVARFAQVLVRQNFILTFIYNAVAIPVAFAGWVTPLVAALAMSGSSLMVIGNAFRLRRDESK